MNWIQSKDLCLVLMIKNISKAMDMVDKLLIARVDYKKTVIFITNQKSFFVKHISLFFSLVRPTFLSSMLNLENTKNLKIIKVKQTQK